LGDQAGPALVLTSVVLALFLAPPSPAHAQASFSVTAESQYRFRGVPLTNGKPDLRLALAYDHPSGAYAGASAIIGTAPRGGVQAMGYSAYVGYARRAGPDLSWDAGLTHARYIGRLPGRAVVPGPRGPAAVRYTLHYDSDYSEAYAGLVRRDVSAHLYVSPDYLGQGQTTAYLDLAGAVRPAPRVRLFGHAGVLAPLAGRSRVYAPPGIARPAGGDDRRLVYDLRVGAALELGRAEVQLAWTHVGPRLEYPRDYSRRRDALVVSAAAFF
jgi:uncharacterized protein (TIGR02001 family)